VEYSLVVVAVVVEKYQVEMLDQVAVEQVIHQQGVVVMLEQLTQEVEQEVVLKLDLRVQQADQVLSS
tara:strand:- start:39 stop:239 length:201 start_codon:yes stop_codon:yes gene_type:complete